MKYSIITIKEYPLKEKRNKKGISLRGLAKLTGIDYSHLQRLEKGTFVAKEETAKKIVLAITLSGTKVFAGNK